MISWSMASVGTAVTGGVTGAACCCGGRAGGVDGGRCAVGWRCGVVAGSRTVGGAGSGWVAVACTGVGGESPAAPVPPVTASPEAGVGAPTGAPASGGSAAMLGDGSGNPSVLPNIAYAPAPPPITTTAAIAAHSGALLFAAGFAAGAATARDPAGGEATTVAAAAAADPGRAPFAPPRAANVADAAFTCSNSPESIINVLLGRIPAADGSFNAFTNASMFLNRSGAFFAIAASLAAMR